MHSPFLISHLSVFLFHPTMQKYGGHQILTPSIFFYSDPSETLRCQCHCPALCFLVLKTVTVPFRFKRHMVCLFLYNLCDSPGSLPKTILTVPCRPSDFQRRLYPSIFPYGLLFLFHSVSSFRRSAERIYAPRFFVPIKKASIILKIINALIPIYAIISKNSSSERTGIPNCCAF